MSKLRYILYIILLALFPACTENLDVLPVEDNETFSGEEVMFSAHVPQVKTRGAKEDYFQNISELYDEVQEDYTFMVEMYEEGNSQKIASGEYNPTKNTVGDVTTYDEYGTLKESSAALYWPSNVKKYAFHAVSTNSSTTLESDQTDQEKIFKQDLIEGYGFVPEWDASANEGNGAPMAGRHIDDFNYLTAKEWYSANKAWGTPSGMTNNEQLVAFWKKIPLFMQHKRSRITILLKAGEGVEREQIAYNEFTEDHIAAKIYSYDDDDHQQEITPMLGSYDCDYTPTISDDPENTVLTACYEAIVNPHNYAKDNRITDQKILSINLSGMKFSFTASNDYDYNSEEDADISVVLNRYNLQEGKHLILTVTLSTDTRKILITAYVCDWIDYPFSSVCDDFGNSSKPESINNKDELIAMLTNPDKNQPGKVFVILPEDFNLLTEGGWNPADYELKATLKLAGAKITTNNRLFKSIAPSGSISNGSIVIADASSGNNPLDCAIAQDNYGNIDRINVSAGETTRKATRAGLTTTNYGTINYCSSQLPVYNDGGSDDVLVGGIAAEMKYRLGENDQPDLSTMPIINLCNVNARIDGGSNVKGGGIVGSAEGKLTNNTFEYGITLMQDVNSFKNIIYVKGTESLEANGNEWSTKAANTITGVSIENSRPLADLYEQVIDSQRELEKMLTDGTYNKSANRIRIADSFTVGDANDTNPWTLGKQHDNLTGYDGNLLCSLDGNNKTITLTGKEKAQMLFSNIVGNLYDLNILLDKPIEALPDPIADELSPNRLPARAPLAYSVAGANAKIENIQVKMGATAYVKASSPAGLVVWAYDGATIQDCKSDVDVRIVTPESSGSQQTYFVGGLVNTAAKATISRCTYEGESLNDSEEANAVSGSSIYYGGIVGGTNSKSLTSQAPDLTIVDCVSWLTWTESPTLPHDAWGGIIGYSKYGQSTDLHNAMNANCQGNWWAAPVGAPARGRASGMTEEKVIGKKNSVQPTK